MKWYPITIEVDPPAGKLGDLIREVRASTRPDFVSTESVYTGVPVRLIERRHHRFGDYFSAVELEGREGKLRIVFYPKDGASSHWKDLVVQAIRAIRKNYSEPRFA